MRVMRLLRGDVESRASARGYSLEEIAGCFLRVVEGDLWEVDVEHNDYPRAAKSGNVPGVSRLPVHGGPGTELSQILKRLGIEPTPACPCRDMAAQMDALGADECSKPQRIAWVVAAMRAEAQARGLPFLDAAGRMLVRRAIANARRNA